MSSQIKNLDLDKKWFYGSHGYTDKLVNFFFKASRSDILPFSDVFILYDISNTARRDGRVIKEARRSWRSSILDCTTDAESAEQLRQRVMGHVLLKESANISIDNWHSGVVCGRGRNPTLRLWPTIFSGKIDVFPGDRRSRLISSMTSVAPA